MPDAALELTWFDQAQAERIASAFSNNHAILMSGAQGIGKSHLARTVCQQLFTQTENKLSDQLYQAGTHPDIHVLTSAFAFADLDGQLQKLSLRYLSREALEKKRLSRQISVDTVRRLVESMNESSALGGLKLALIYPLEHLNINSANAILKFLEEPTDNTVLLLVSHDISRLPATIRSRCMRIDIPLPNEQASFSWLSNRNPELTQQEISTALSLAGKRPLLAQAYISSNQSELVNQIIDDIGGLVSTRSTNVVEVSRRWVKYKQTDFIVVWLGQLFCELIKVKLGKSDSDLINNSKAQSLAQKLPIERLFKAYDYFTSLRKSYDGVVDETLLIEGALINLVNSNDTVSVNV